MPAEPPSPADLPPAPPPPWAEVRALLEQALALGGAQREALLAQPGWAPALVAEVRSLLAYETASGAAPTGRPGAAAGAAAATGFLARPALALAAGLEPLAPETGREGQRLGAWRIVRRLGAGGMGEVWLAERADGAFAGAAAIKVLKRGMDSAAVLARFALEQQALARLQHPHIAHLLDAGRTPDGLPYFVMEHVQGQPIDAATRGLPLAARLQLFLQLADAVAHAHRSLLVHRDLKPGNVLVTAQGQVKLLDFGIAKALAVASEGAADPQQTQLGDRLFTPHYASPEQVRGEPVGTATDVYSLGVLLYGVLTGVRPTGRQATTAFEAARCVLEEAPTRPSALPASAVADPHWPATRKRLRGDLDNILLKALDKSVERRYASVDALAADVRAHLTGFPVSARTPSWAYLAGRFARRHAAVVGVAALAAVGLVGTAGVALWQAQVADAQREVAQQRFKQVRDLARQLVFKYHDQIENLPGATQARESLLVDAAAFLDNLGQAAPDDLQLADELASTYYRISRLQGVDTSINTGQHAQAEANLDKALALTRRYVQRPDTPLPSVAAAISMHVSKAELWQRRGRMREAEAALREALPLLDAALKRDPRDTWALTSAITVHGVLARILGSNLANATQGRWRDACDSADRARAAAEATLAADPANRYGPDSLAFTLGEQAQCRLLAGDAEAARALFGRQVALRDQMAATFPDDMDFRYQRSISRGNLARVLSAAGQHAAALRLLDEALILAQAAAAADPGNQAGAPRIDALRVTRLELLLAAGDMAAARRLAPAVLEHLPAPAPEAGFGRLRARAEALLWAARAWRPTQPARALALARDAARLLQPAGADDDNVTRRWLLALAQGEEALALAQGADRPLQASATEAARRALQIWQVRPPDEGPPPALQRWMAPVQALAQVQGER